MRKLIFKFFFILIAGVLGGIIFQALILPYLATKEYFKKFGFVKILTEREVNLYPKETVIVRENKALQDAVEKVARSVVGVRAQLKQGKILEGSGLILTADGYLVAPADIFPKGYNFSLFLEREQLTFKILKIDSQENLILAKIEKTNLSTLPFADTSTIKMGQRVFLVGIIFEKSQPKKIVNEGIIKTFDENFIRTNIFEKSNLAGSPLFDIEGNILGINTVDKEGRVIAISAKKIREFTGF